MGKILTTKQRQELLYELTLERWRRYAERIKVILLLDSGETYKNIAKFLFIDEGTIANYQKRYKEGGLEALINDKYAGRKFMLTEEDLTNLDMELQERVFLTTDAIIAYVKKRFGMKYSRGGMTALLHRMGFSFKKPKRVPGKAKRNAQEKFLKEYEQAKSQEGAIYFGDAVHPTHNTELHYGWIKKGTDFEIKTNSGRGRININGAIDIESFEVLARSYDSINQNTVCDFLIDLRLKHGSDEKITLILDNASYYTANSVKDMAKLLGIKLLFVPAYSPNLNLIERLWKFMRRKAIPNEYIESFNDWRNAIMGFFKKIKKYRPELKTLMAENFELLGA